MAQTGSISPELGQPLRSFACLTRSLLFTSDASISLEVQSQAELPQRRMWRSCAAQPLAPGVSSLFILPLWAYCGIPWQRSSLLNSIKLLYWKLNRTVFTPPHNQMWLQSLICVCASSRALSTTLFTRHRHVRNPSSPPHDKALCDRPGLVRNDSHATSLHPAIGPCASLAQQTPAIAPLDKAMGAPEGSKTMELLGGQRQR